MHPLVLVPFFQSLPVTLQLYHDDPWQYMSDKIFYILIISVISFRRLDISNLLSAKSPGAKAPGFFVCSGLGHAMECPCRRYLKSFFFGFYPTIMK